ncbi:MAG: hypothetical protein JRG72_11110 [Deltaproteobacteria bacterium]|nr:hypothetical protein [Deltaproteobacteria bacterium]
MTPTLVLRNPANVDVAPPAAKVIVAVETPTDKPRFAAMRMVPRVSSEEIQPLVGERLAVRV